MSIRLTLKQTGFFLVQAQDRANQCGPLGNDVNKYALLIRCGGDDLCPRGFIIDNTRLHAFFAEKFSGLDVYPSCENLAWQACIGIVDMLVKDGRRPLYVSVEITSAPDQEPRKSSMRAEWEYDPHA